MQAKRPLECLFKDINGDSVIIDTIKPQQHVLIESTK